MSLLGELKRRNVFRVGVAYLLGAWVLLQGADFALDVIGAPNWIIQALTVLAAIGLPAVLIFAWVFEMTPQGLKRESEIERNQSITPQTGTKLDRVIITFLAVAVALLLADRFLGNRAPAEPPFTEVADQPTQPKTVVSEAAVEDALSIAVLPFVNMSADPQQEFFSDGLAEELLNRLAKTDRLRVAARTSSFQFKGQNLDIADIGRQLKVAHVLEGSVRKAGDRVRVTAQLIKVGDGYHLWSETYERQLDDIFSIQDEISGAITTALKLELGVQETPDRPTENLEAYQLFLQARHALAKRGADNLHRALSLFDQAIELDPQFARAYSGAAFTWALLPGYGGANPKDARVQATRLAELALELDPDNAEVHIAMARLQGNYDGAIAEAEKSAEAAHRLEPNNVDVVNLYGDFLFMIGKLDEAEAMERRAVELDPLSAVHHSDLAFVLLARRKNDEALEYARTSARLEPDVIERLDPLVYALVVTGDFEEAGRLIDQIEASMPGADKYTNTWRCFVAYRQQDMAGLRALMNERMAMDPELVFTTYTILGWYTLWLDGPEKAIPMLQKALDTQEYLLTWPEFFFLPEMLSDDPDFLAFWEQPGLGELMKYRRANWDRRPMGYWQERPVE